jgi:hypothetical protein
VTLVVAQQREPLQRELVEHTERAA